MSVIVDANVLLNAVRSTAPDFAVAHRWFEDALNSRTTVSLPWASTLAFLRISTNPRMREWPISPERGLELIRDWLARPNVVVPEPDSRHHVRLAELLAAAGRGGDLVSDAHLAALAVQLDATIITFDSDFARFPGVRWQRPTA